MERWTVAFRRSSSEPTRRRRGRGGAAPRGELARRRPAVPLLAPLRDELRGARRTGHAALRPPLGAADGGADAACGHARLAGPDDGALAARPVVAAARGADPA